MEPQYAVLRTIYDIVQHDPQPETYKCRPREIILRIFQDWGIIQQHLGTLESEGLILMKQLDTLVIYITASGIEKVRLLTEGIQSHN
jgi:DNA-binding MarR family transcriptional regulator